MKSKSAFNGVIVLTMALLIVKVLSALYRVPYQNVLGDAGLYAYQQVYPIVALGVVLSSNAIPSAYTRVMSAHYHNRWAFKRLCIILTCIGFVGSVLLFISAPWIAYLMGDTMLTPMLRAASVCFVIIGGLGLLRGYFQAQYNMNIPAYSQVLEQTIRVGIIGIVIVLFMTQGLSIYEAGFWAIIASVFGFISATLLLGWRYRSKSSQETLSLPWKQFLVSIVVFAVSHLIVILWQVIDSFTVVNTLRHGAELAFQQAIAQKGIFDRGASFIQMGLIVTTTFCFVLIPLLTETQRLGQYQKMNDYANASLKITIVISSASGIGLINLLSLLNRVFFESDALTSTLSIYMFTVILVSLIMMYISLLEVQGRLKTIWVGLGIGMISKLILNILLIREVGIIGASTATVISLCLFVIYLHRDVAKQYHLNDLRFFYLKLIGALCIMTIVVQLWMQLMHTTTRVGGFVELLIGALLGVIGVIVAIIVLNVLNEEEWSHLPFGDKVYRLKKGRKK